MLKQYCSALEMIMIMKISVTFRIFVSRFIDIEVLFILQIKLQNVTRLCHTKSIMTVNGQFPGPRIVAREGDRLLIKVVNHVQNNISIHW